MNIIVSRRKGLLLAATLAVTLGVTGCLTTSQVKDLGPLFEVAAYTGTKVYLAENPGKEELFKSAVGLLDALAADPQINAAKFAAALQTLPIKELRDPKAAILIGSSIVLWEAYKDRIPVVDEAVTVRPLVIRVRNGIGLAIGMGQIAEPLPATRERMSTPLPTLRRIQHR
jgi:hypothetical protein